MIAKVTTVYRCHWCSALSNSAELEWCLCRATQPSLVCRACKRCICTAPAEVKRKFWELASADLIASRRQAAHRSAPQAAEGEAFVRPVILVVDDSKTIHTVVDTILSSFTGTILHAHDGATALRMARSIQPEILLTDALLPGLDGRDVARFLKSDPSTASIRTIIMTAPDKGSRHRAEAFRNFKVDAYIEKPVTAAQLRAVIDEMLALSASAEESIAS